MGPVAEEEPKIAERMAEDESIELIDYLLVVWSYRWLIGLGTAAAIVAALVYGFLTPKSYQASLLLKVGTVFTLSGDGSRLGLIEDPKTIAQVLTGDAMLDKLRGRLTLDHATLSGLRGALNVKVIKNDLDVAATTLVELTLTLSDPRQIIDGLNFLANDLIEEHAHQYLAGLSVIDREQESLKEKIRVSDLQQGTLRRQIADLRAQMTAESKYRETLERNIARLEGEMSQAMSRLAEAKPDASEALWEQTLFQSRQIHLDELYRERNESELRGRKAQADVYGVESTATGLAGQRADYENRIVELAASRTRSENTKIRSAPVLPTIPVGPRRGLIVMMAGLLGAGAFVLAAFFLEYVRNARRRRDFSREFFPT
jgi:uncharacterized protein involved in exopolysaccharide biosynthesis